jgi:hypothetical protein
VRAGIAHHPALRSGAQIINPLGQRTASSYSASGMAEERSQAPAKDVIASASVGAAHGLALYGVEQLLG